ncbi:MAG: hypothetical protein HIU89_16140 [Proteobacteria bacterium]|nr:hypothetical protein [Pseudomonadota bacterium]
MALIAAPAAALLALVATSQDSDGKNTCRAVLEQLRSSRQFAVHQAAAAVQARVKKPART